MGIIITRDRFEEVGVELQESSRSYEQSKARFNKSCALCSMYGRCADCNACPIAESGAAMAKWFGRPVDYFYKE